MPRRSKQNLTKRFLDSITPLEGKEFIVWDASLTGFGVRVKPSGRKSFLYKYRTPDEFNIPALPARAQKMDYFAWDEIDISKAKRQLAPLVRGYARLGCYIGDGAVIDEQFNTTDVLILLLVDRLRKTTPQLFEDK